MVHAPAQGRPTAAASSTPSTIAGGFVPIGVASLMAAWRACRAAPLGIGDFRAWLAVHEMRARRPAAGRGAAPRSPSYGFAELARLTGVEERRAGASARRLVAAGLLAWSDSEVAPLGPAEGPALDAIGGGRGSLAVPRRLLRFLCAGAPAAVVAAAVGVLLRCLSRRKGGWDGRGRIKSSWVAEAFGISIPAAKAARRRLVGLGWIAPEGSSQWSMNRFGRAFAIDLAWEAPRAGEGSSSIPPSADPGPDSIPPDLHPEPLREFENQDPGGPGPAGARPGEKGGGPRPSRAIVEAGATRPMPATSPPAGMVGPPPRAPEAARGVPAPPPRLEDVRLEDLKDTARLLELHGQAVARGLVGRAEADRLGFAAAAEHALAAGKRNPPGLFAHLVRRGRWGSITQADEDSARRRLKVHEFGPPAGGVGVGGVGRSMPMPTAGLGLSEDARLVREVRSAMIRAGIYRDPWPAFRARNPAWDPGRWEAAMAELGLG